MKSFIILVFLLVQISIAWSLYKIANKKDISFWDCVKRFAVAIKKIITSPWVKYTAALLFFIFSAICIMTLRGALRSTRHHRAQRYNYAPARQTQPRVLTAEEQKKIMKQLDFSNLPDKKPEENEKNSYILDFSKIPLPHQKHEKNKKKLENFKLDTTRLPDQKTPEQAAQEISKRLGSADCILKPDWRRGCGRTYDKSN